MSELSNSKKNNSNSLLQSIFFLRLKSLIGLVTGEKRRLRFTVNPAKLAKDLEKLRNLLVLLRKENKSREPEYLETLSLIWKEVKKNCPSLLNAKPKKESTEKILQGLLLSIEQFPKNTEYSLGYFLSKEVGDEWSPFHLMEMLKELHLEYQELADNSMLAIWTERIEAILDGIVY
jgi:hypothetical protein